jgi:DinB superfamily
MHSHLQRALEEMQTATGGIRPDGLLRRRQGKWSVAEILEHLALAFGSTSKLLAKHLESGQPAAARPTLRQRMLSTAVITLGQFPEGRPAPPFTLPAGSDPQGVIQLFRENLAGMDQMIARCEQRFGSGTRIASHFIFGPLTAAQWRKFHFVHTRHHMKQVRKLIG